MFKVKYLRNLLIFQGIMTLKTYVIIVINIMVLQLGQKVSCPCLKYDKNVIIVKCEPRQQLMMNVAYNLTRFPKCWCNM